MTLKRILALALSAILLAAMPLSAIADTEADAPAADAIQVQGIDLKEGESKDLDAGEVEVYKEIAATIAGSEEDSLTIPQEDGTSITYTLEDSKTGEDQTVLTAVTTSEETVLGVTGVSEIVLMRGVPAGETPAEETPAEETPAEETPAEETPAEEPVVVDELKVPALVEDAYGNMDGIYEGVYAPESENAPLASLTMGQLLAGLGEGLTGEDLEIYQATDAYQTYVDFAASVGLGKDVPAITAKLREIVDEYQANQAAYDDYLAALEAYEQAVASGDANAVKPEPVEAPTVPLFSLEDLEISMDKEIAASGEGYITEIVVNADAVYNVQYDGDVEVEVEVPVEGGTDFVITLDVSTSMDGSADKAMLQALKAVLDKIMANDENTVSIVFYGSGANVMTLDINGETLNSFSPAMGITADDIFNTKLPGSQYSLNDLVNGSGYVLSAIRGAYGVSGNATNTASGLDAAYAMLEKIYGGDSAPVDRNTGVLLFTDGAANRPSYTAKESAIVAERKLVEDFGATVVNVALGTSSNYTNYMDPSDPNYLYNASSSNSVIRGDYTAERELLLEQNVVYYNIPKMSNDQLAVKISEMFEAAFKTITTTTTKLESGVIADGVLAAVQSKLIDTIPATMEIVSVAGNSTGYKVLGKDENGNTLIEWDLGNLYSGDELTFSYFMVPVDGATDLKVDIATGVDTVLVTNPMDKVINNDNNTQIAIVHLAENSTSQATLPKTGVDTVPAAILWMGLIASLVGFVAAKRYA